MELKYMGIKDFLNTSIENIGLQPRAIEIIGEHREHGDIKTVRDLLPYANAGIIYVYLQNYPEDVVRIEEILSQHNLRLGMTEFEINIHANYPKSILCRMLKTIYVLALGKNITNEYFDRTTVLDLIRYSNEDIGSKFFTNRATPYTKKEFNHIIKWLEYHGLNLHMTEDEITTFCENEKPEEDYTAAAQQEMENHISGLIQESEKRLGDLTAALEAEQQKLAKLENFRKEARKKDITPDGLEKIGQNLGKKQ